MASSRRRRYLRRKGIDPVEIRSRIGKLIYSDPKTISPVHLVHAALAAGVSLKDADLCAWILEGVCLEGSVLDMADLQGADLRRANLNQCKLSAAKLNRARLTDASLEGANLTSAELNDVDLLSVNAKYANFTGAELNGATYCAQTILPFSDEEAKRRGMLKVDR